MDNEPGEHKNILQTEPIYPRREINTTVGTTYDYEALNDIQLDRSVSQQAFANALKECSEEGFDITPVSSNTLKQLQEAVNEKLGGQSYVQDLADRPYVVVDSSRDFRIFNIFCGETKDGKIVAFPVKPSTDGKFAPIDTDTTYGAVPVIITKDKPFGDQDTKHGFKVSYPLK